MIPGAGLFLVGGQQHSGPIPAWKGQHCAEQQPMVSSGPASGNLIPNSFVCFPFVAMGFQERLFLHNIH